MTANQIEIYVRSSPLGKVGIHWRKASEDFQSSQRTETPDILMEEVVPDDDSKLSVNSVINTVKPCLILAKYNGKVFLEVTGIDATPDRSEKLGRRISEVVLWVGDDNKETEEKLRKLAYCALLGLWKPDSKFRTAISSSIEFDGLNDYKVNAKKLIKIYHDPKHYIPEELLSSDLDLIDQTSQDWLVQDDLEKIESEKEKVVQLANRLLQASFKGLDVAIAITEIKQKEEKIYLNYRTHIVEAPKVIEPLRILPPPVEPSKDRDKSTPISNPPEKKSRLIVLTMILLAILLTTLIWSLQQNNLDQEREPETISFLTLNFECQTCEDQTLNMPMEQPLLQPK